jgi:hypothetical protein
VATVARSLCIAGAILGVVAFGWVPVARGASPEEIEQRLKALEGEIQTLKQQLEDAKKAPPVAAPAPPATAPPAAPAPASAPTPAVAAPAPATPGTESPLATSLASIRPSWVTDFKIGGYGSTRFEASDLSSVNDSFTWRRFVLTGDATIADRIRTYFELELERLTELEVERTTVSENGFQGFSQSIEGSNHSEISLEQAWVELYLADWLKFRMGNILVPVGRFNINHDDNRWDLPRRSLVDRGVPVLPSTAAWSEVGLGFNGDIKTERAGNFGYQVYVMNGVTLDSSIETFARGSGEFETEVEIQPRRGTADLDLKGGKAGALRLSWSPILGQEFGVSGYFGRYTPDFLPSQNLWSVAADGKLTFGPFEVEGQYVRTHFNNVNQVARGFAQSVTANEISSETSPLESTVEFELASLADTKQGYWLEFRYRFFPDFLRNTFLAWKFENPQFIAVTRWEQAWLSGLVTGAEFADGLLTLEKQNRFIDRLTVGLAYRPVPLVVFQLAYERTWTNPGQSLSSVTNFIPAGSTDNVQNAFLFGVAFGF